MTDDALQRELRATAHALADAARAVTLGFFRSENLGHDNKDSTGFDPVTEADRAAEQVMRDILQERRPADSILGEEFGKTEGTSGLTWVLDPIDGTRGFISGTPTWGVLISVRDETGPLFGIIDQPYIAERFAGGFGEAWTEGPRGRKQLRVREKRRLGESILFSTYPELRSRSDQDAFEEVVRRAKLVRYSMDCYGYALLAAGQIDLVIETDINPYDIQAPIAVITGAGGILTDWEGRPAHEGGRVIAASCPELHAEVIELLG